MPEPLDGPPLLRLALSPTRKTLAVFRENVHSSVLEIIPILPDGRLAETQRVTHLLEREVNALRWISDEELLLLGEQAGTAQLSAYRLESGKLHRVLTASIGVPARIIAASSQSGSLEVLLAIRTKQGVRFGLFLPQTNRYQMIGAPWPRAKFGAWNPQERLLGVNVALTAADEQLQGIIYRYGGSGDQIVDLQTRVGRQCIIKAFDQGKNVCLTANSGDGFQFPGTHALETDETHWFEHLGFSAQALELSRDGELMLCGGLVEADWRHVIARVDGEGEESVDVESALLLDPVFCQDSRYLLAQYQTPGLAPTLCRYDRQTQTCEIVLHAPEQDRAPQIRAQHWWARVPTLGRLPVVSFTTPATDYDRIVLFLHGGPHLNIFKAYSPFLSRLAEQGFWVVAPNFPGSIGYGAAYEQMLRGDWGGIDVQSVIELAEMLIQQGKGANRRLAVYGASYGGYLALLAAGLRSDLWHCVIAGAPFTDLQDLYQGANEQVKGILQGELGSLLENQAELAARSPISYVQALSQLPLLLLHGANDTVCPTRQSRRLAESLADGGKHLEHFEYHELSDLKHELYSERFWAETAMNFLTRHIRESVCQIDR